MNRLYKFVVRFVPHHLHHESDGGFTMVEILIVAAIIGVLSMMLVLNFRSSGSNITARNQTIASIVSDIRRAQTMSINSSTVGGVIVCGYGAHYIPNVDSNNYIIYAKPRPIGGCSTLTTRNYEPGKDTSIQTIFLANPNFEIKTTACPVSSGLSFTGNGNDIFFEPPDPKTYLANNPPIYSNNILITVDLKSGASDCSGDYSTIMMKSAGAIDVCTAVGGGTCN